MTTHPLAIFIFIFSKACNNFIHTLTLYSLICSRGLLPRPGPVPPTGAGWSRHYEPSSSTAATTTSASSTHTHQTRTQTGNVSTRLHAYTLSRFPLGNAFFHQKKIFGTGNLFVCVSNGT